MHSVEALGILSCASCFPSEAVGETCHLDRKVLFVEDSVLVVSAESDFSCSYKTCICSFDGVDVAFSSAGIEADSVKNLFLGHVWSNEWCEAMLHDDIHGISLKSHLEDYSLVLDIVELLSGNLCTFVEIQDIQFFTQLYMVLCLEWEVLWLSEELDCKIVLVFLSDRSFRGSVVWNCHGFLSELLVDFSKLCFLCGKLFLDVLSFLDESLSCFVVQLLLHLLGCLISLASEILDFQKERCPFILVLDDLVKVHIHISVLDVLCNFVVSGLQFLYVNHLGFPPYHLALCVISSLFLTVASTASCTIEANPPSVRAFTPSMVVPRGEHTIVSSSIAPLPVAF